MAEGEWWYDLKTHRSYRTTTKRRSPTGWAPTRRARRPNAHSRLLKSATRRTTTTRAGTTTLIVP